MTDSNHRPAAERTNDAEARRPWSTPGLVLLPVEAAKGSLTTQGDDGILFS